jgi:hypothetical protein
LNKEKGIREKGKVESGSGTGENDPGSGIYEERGRI